VKETQKYTKACKILKIDHQHQEELYYALNVAGWFWDSRNKEWNKTNITPYDPSDLYRVRVTTTTKQENQFADVVTEALESYGMKLVDRTLPYVRRPPYQLESRVYLSFQGDKVASDLIAIPKPKFELNQRVLVFWNNEEILSHVVSRVYDLDKKAWDYLIFDADLFIPEDYLNLFSPKDTRGQSRM
jgi:hypothetical protein